MAIALGSNLGDRLGHLRSAIDALGASVLTDVRVSRVIETAPDPPGPAPPYLNAALVAHTTRSARALLEALLALEGAHGRTRPFANAPRTLDLDLILYGDAVLNEHGLVVPHPRFRERRFVLDPLAEIAPDWIDPVSGLTIARLAAR